ncbi:MAG: 3-hydroxyacyl-CoA dehydrogenase/enoyl-CoA hydratase family protein [Aggregatilineales bacterium]
MTYHIRKAGVIGSGTMGSGIASLLAAVGIPVVLLDIAAKGTQPGDPSAKRNAVVLDNLNKLKKSRPAQLFHPDDAARITPGNLADNLDLLADADWIVEVVVEKLDVKQELMAKLDEIRRPDAIVTSNTSGLSINAIAQGRSDSFRRYFLGTHFFNPPRYMYLLEVIPGVDTAPELVEFIAHFATNTLGKGVVICRDTPNFIANRFISVPGTFASAYAINNSYTVEETDLLTGPLIGRPKSGTFRLSDIVGNDISVHVGANLYDAIPNDESREVIRDPGVTRVYDFLMKNNYLGNKTGQGFYKRVDVNGEKQFWPLDLQKFEYVPPQKVRFDSVGKHRKIEDTGTRIKALINETDRAGQFLWHVHAFYLAYASRRLAELADSLTAIDNANKWGFAHELGPFEIWDAIGVRETVPRMEADGYQVAPWVHDMLNKGVETFYRRDAAGRVTGVYDPVRGDYAPTAENKHIVVIRELRSAGKEIVRNAGASLIDLGDGIGLLEFHSKANAIDEDILTMTGQALERLERELAGLVIGNDGDNFCVGANVFFIAMLAQAKQFDQIERAIKASQDLMQRLRYATKPVVTAPFGQTLGGGAEFAMAGSRIVAHVELYAGLVELGVGLIPGSGGNKELLRRVVNPIMQASPIADPLPHMQKVFEQIALAKVSDSAMTARDMGFLSVSDRIVMDRRRLIAEAKRTALEMAPNFTPLPPQKIYAAGRDVRAALHMATFMMRDAGYISDYDHKLANTLANVLCGGELSAPGWVDEQYMLDLEREAFVRLAGEPKTLERISHFLQTGKPLRN